MNGIRHCLTFLCAVREVQESLCCAEHKAVKLFRELEDIDVVQTAFEIFLIECSKNQKQAL